MHMCRTSMKRSRPCTWKRRSSWTSWKSVSASWRRSTTGSWANVGERARRARGPSGTCRRSSAPRWRSRLSGDPTRSARSSRPRSDAEPPYRRRAESTEVARFVEGPHSRNSEDGARASSGSLGCGSPQLWFRGISPEWMGSAGRIWTVSSIWQAVVAPILCTYVLTASLLVVTAGQFLKKIGYRCTTCGRLLIRMRRRPHVVHLRMPVAFIWHLTIFFSTELSVNVRAKHAIGTLVRRHCTKTPNRHCTIAWTGLISVSQPPVRFSAYFAVIRAQLLTI